MIRSDIEKISKILPGIKRMAIDPTSWNRLAHELLQIQRVGVNGFSDMKQYLHGPILCSGIEVWNSKEEIPSDD